MKTKHNFIILLCLIAVLGPTRAMAQDKEEAIIISPYMDLIYLKNTDNQGIINARLYDATDLGEKALAGMTIKLYTNVGEMELLGELVTDKKGEARYIVPDDMVLPVDDDNYWGFYAEFEGKDNIEMTMAEIMVMDVNLEMTLTENEEQGRLVNLSAYTMVEDEKVPVTDEEIFVFVPRMFSFLSVGVAYLEDGQATIEFPYDIPGDEHGKLVVVGRFHEHWQFANVEKRIESNWGIPSSHEVAETHRALWTQIAPLWMIITLSVMLAGVWGHYLYAIISLFRIKKAGKNMTDNN